MYIIYALLAALFSGLTTLFAKIGLKNTNSNLVTGIRTIIIFISMLFIFLFGIKYEQLNTKTIIYLLLSGLTTALLWIFYFKALLLANINKVTPVDKTSVILTLILSSIFFKEKITIIKIISIIFLLIGTYLMVGKNNKKTNNNWFIYAVFTAILTSIATILGKLGISNINPNLGNFIRTIIILIITWIYIIIKKDYKDLSKLNKKNYLFIILSGISTSLSWIFYFIALKSGEASIVFPIEKLSAAVSIISASIFLKEKMNKKNILGFILVLISIILLIIK